MRLIQEMKRYNYHANVAIPTVHCTLFEDNSGALTLAKAPAMRPRTKHINLNYHHFRAHVAALPLRPAGEATKAVNRWSHPMMV
jgi:hypothetical protein